MVRGVGAADDVGRQPALAFEPCKRLERRRRQHPAEIPDHRLDHHFPCCLNWRCGNRLTCRVMRRQPVLPSPCCPWRFPRDGLFPAAMRTLTVTTAALALSLSGPAAAIVGGAAPSTEGIGRSVVT